MRVRRSGSGRRPGAVGLALLGAPLLAVIGCDQRRDAGAARSDTESAVVFTTLPPLAYFVERLVGDSVQVDALVQPGQSPHTFEPTPKQMTALSAAAIYFHIDEAFEQRLVEKLRATNPDTRFVDIRTGLDLLPMAPHGDDHTKSPPDDDSHAEHDHADHDHGHDHAEDGHGDHDHGAIDPHVWLDPRRMKIAARGMCETLAEQWPQHAATYRENLEKLETELDALDAGMREKLKDCAGKPFFVTHAAFGYFADAYGLEQVSIESGGRQPGPRELQQVMERLKSAGARRVFFDPQTSRNLVDTLQSQPGIALESLDPLAADYFVNMRHIGERVAAAIGEAP